MVDQELIEEIRRFNAGLSSAEAKMINDETDYDPPPTHEYSPRRAPSKPAVQKPRTVPVKSTKAQRAGFARAPLKKTVVKRR